MAEAIEGAADEVVATGGRPAGPQLNASHAVVASAIRRSGRRARTAASLGVRGEPGEERAAGPVAFREASGRDR